MPRNSEQSAVTFSRKWIVAGLAAWFESFSTIATEVSSLLRIGLVEVEILRSCGMAGTHQDDSIARVSKSRL